MRLHLAVGTATEAINVLNDAKYPNILVSYAYKNVINKLDQEIESFIVDSGAFSAWNKGKVIDLEGYRDWALSQQDRPSKKFMAVNLDVIPGEKGRTSSQGERIAGIKQSLINADYLRDAGLPIMEVFHQDEPLSFLAELCDRLPVDGVLGISPRNDVSVKRKMEWQKVVLRYLIQRYGKSAFPRCHGLAVTSRQMLETFPYYSVDSSTWVSPAMYGSVVSEEGRLLKIKDNLLPIAPRNQQTGGLKTVLRMGVENLIILERSMTASWTARGISWKD